MSSQPRHAVPSPSRLTLPSGTSVPLRVRSSRSARDMAAEPGFPWQALPSDPEKGPVIVPLQNGTTAQPDKKKRDEVSTSPVKTATSQQSTQHRHHSNSLHGRPHRGSIKGPPRVSYAIPNHPPDSTISKATSPLPVRTIPGKPVAVGEIWRGFANRSISMGERCRRRRPR